MTRRMVLAFLGGAIAALLTPCRAVAQACRQLVAADNGPFYPKEAIPLTNDLVIGKVGPRHLPGVLLYFAGTVLDDQCRPVAGAMVEIWQCDSGGRYRHPNAPKLKPLEPAFRYFSKTPTDAEGRFVFRTLRPAPYVAFGTPRAPHIHVKIKAAGHAVATTEVYFHGDDDEARQGRDPIFLGRGPRRGEMLAMLVPASTLRNRLTTAPEPDALGILWEFALV